MLRLVIALLVVSNSTGKTLVRTQPGTMIPVLSGAGPLFLDDANTVAHLTWNGVSLVDSRGNAWSMHATVPQIAKGGKTPAGAGPYSSSNYYTLGSGSDVIDFTGNFTACFAFQSNVHPATSNFGLFSDHIDNVGGWGIYLGSSDAPALYFHRSGANSVVTDSTYAITVGSPSVICVGRTGTTGALQLNAYAYKTGSSGAITAGTTATAGFSGWWSGNPGTANAYMYEAWFTSTAPSSALFAAYIARAKAKLGITAW